MNRRRVGAVGAGVLAFALCGLAGPPVSGQGGFDWRDYAGSPGGSRYVPLTQINKSNVSQLQVAWSYPHGATGFNPLVVREALSS